MDNFFRKNHQKSCEKLIHNASTIYRKMAYLQGFLSHTHANTPLFDSCTRQGSNISCFAQKSLWLSHPSKPWTTFWTTFPPSGLGIIAQIPGNKNREPIQVSTPRKRSIFPPRCAIGLFAPCRVFATLTVLISSSGRDPKRLGPHSSQENYLPWSASLRGAAGQ